MPSSLKAHHEQSWFERETDIQAVQKGGWINCHHHLCSAYSLNEKWFKALTGDISLPGKWGLSDGLKTDPEYLRTLEERMRRSIHWMIEQRVTGCLAYINVDTVVGLMEIAKAVELKKEYLHKGFHLVLAAYACRDIRNDEEQKILIEALTKFPQVQFVGSVPSRGRRDALDQETTREAMVILANIAFKYDRSLDAQIDQNNDPDEREAFELVCMAEILRKQGYDKIINGTHLISLGAYRYEDWKLRTEIVKKMAELHVNAIVCPSAAYGMLQDDGIIAPIHSPMAPVRLLLEHGVKVGLGTDNTYDIYEPSGSGDIRVEFAQLWRGVRWQEDMGVMTDIASTFGREIIGLTK